MPDEAPRPEPLSPRTMGWIRAVGWGAFAGAPILLTALATAVSRPSAPPSLVGNAAWAALLAGGLGFAAGALAARGARGAARRLGALAAVVVVAFCAFLLWLATTLPPPG